MKQLRIFVNGTPYEVVIYPGTLPSQIIAQLQLDEEYDLYRLSDPTTYFSEEDIFPLVTQGEHLLAQTIFEAEEAFMKHRAFREGAL